MSKTLADRVLRATTLATLTVGMVACGGGSDDGDGGVTPPPPPPVTFSIGGNVAGLNGTGLVLQNNGGDDLAVKAAGAFAFAARVNAGAAYAITVGTQPVGQTCAVANGSGTASAQVSNVTVTCADVLAFDPAAAFQIGQPLIEDISGDVFGLEAATATHPDNGTSLLVYTQRDLAGEINVFASVLSANGTLGNQTQIGLANGRYSGSVRVKYGPKGKAIAIWHQYVGGNLSQFDVLASVYAAGNWGAATRIAQVTPAGSSAVAPDIAFDTAGNAVAVWSEYGDPGSNKVKSAAFTHETSSWEPPKLVMETPVDTSHSQPRIAMLTSAPTPNYLVLAQRRVGTADVGKLVAYRCAPDRGVACEEAGVEGGPFLPMQEGVPSVSEFDLGSNAAGDVVVGWKHRTPGRETVMMTSRSPGVASTWREAQAVTASEAVNTVPAMPQVHVTAGGAALLAWSRFDFSPEFQLTEEDGVFVKRFTPTATGPMAPSATQAFATSVGSLGVRLSVTDSGNALLLWNSAFFPFEGMGLFSSTFDANASTPVPGPASRVASESGSESYPVALSRGADGKGLLLWADYELRANDFVSELKASRYK